MKTLIAVPCMDTVDAYFARSLAQMARVGDCIVEFEVGTLVNFARDKLAGKAIGAGCDFILWLDSDMVFQEDLMVRLMADIQQGDRDFVTGIYHYRKPPYKPVIWEKFSRKEIHGKAEQEQYLSYPKDRMFEVEACGFGGCLMRTRMVEPIMEKYSALFSQMDRCGEDMSFCARATAMGYKLWADPSIQMGHRGYMICDWQQWDAWQEQEQSKNDLQPQGLRYTAAQRGNPLLPAGFTFEEMREGHAEGSHAGAAGDGPGIRG